MTEAMNVNQGTKADLHLQILNGFLASIIFIFLELYYEHIITDRYSSDGYTFSFDFLKYFETKCLFFLFLSLLHFRNISGFLYGISYIILLFLFVPNLIIYEFMNSPRIIIYSIILIQFLILSIDLRRFDVLFPVINSQTAAALIVIIAVILLIPVVLAYGFDLNFRVLLLQDIYQIRAENASKENFLSGYFYSWLSKIVFPLMLVFGMLQKRPWLIFISFGGLIYLYLTGAHKSAFFALLPVMFFYFFKEYPAKIFFFQTCLILLFLISWILAQRFGYLMPESLFARRIFFDPAVTNLFYLDFFNGNPLYLSHSILGRFIEYPFADQPERIIATIYCHSPAGNANNGIISDGFMNFGAPGIIAFGILFAVLVKLFDSLEIHPAFFGIYFIIIFTFISSFFLTTLLTHGVLLFLVLSTFFLRGANKHYFLLDNMDNRYR